MKVLPILLTAVGLASASEGVIDLVNPENHADQPIPDYINRDNTPGDNPITDHGATFGRLLFHDKLEVIDLYQVLFKGVYGDATITEARIQSAIAQFVRSIQSFDSRFDEGRAAVGAIGGGNDFTVTRSPSLRDLVGPGGSSDGGFMHTGDSATLEQVVAHYNAIPAVVQGLDPRLRRPGGGGSQPQRLNLSSQQQAEFAAFLRTLTGSALYTDPKWSDPSGPGGELALVVLPTGGTKMAFSGFGEARLMTVTMTAVPHVDYVFQWSEDLDEWDCLAVTAGADGDVEVVIAAPASQAQCFYRLAYSPAPE